MLDKLKDNMQSKENTVEKNDLFARLKEIKTAGIEKINATFLPEELQLVRANLIGRKGKVTEILKSVGQASPEVRKILGQAANEVKQVLSDAIDQHNEHLLDSLSSVDGEVDITLPGIVPQQGGLHPITQICYDLNDAFNSLGFEEIRRAHV